MFTLVLTTLSVLSLFSFSNDSKARLHAIQALKGNQINRQLITQPIVVTPIPKPSIGLQNASNYSHSVDPKHGEKCGPFFAALGYYGTKAICYGTALAAGGAAATALAPAGTVGGALATGAMGFVGEACTTTGAGLVAGVITNAGAAATGEAIALTANVIASSGGIAQTVAAVEGAATFVGWLGAMIPGPL